MSTGDPALDVYLARLPRGLDSYPECLAKGSLPRAYLLSKPIDPSLSLPPALREMATRPPIASGWVPEVHFLSIALLVRRAHFATDGAFCDWVKTINAELFRSALYRVLMRVATTHILVAGAERRWKQFHAGTELEAVHDAGKAIDLTFHYPAHLFAPLHVRLFASAVEAAVEATGAGRCRSTVSDANATFARARITW